METCKIIVFFGLFGLLFHSCGKKDTSNMDMLLELQRENDTLKQDRGKAVDDRVETEKQMDFILALINSISGRIPSLERFDENTLYDNSQKVDEIIKDINFIKEKLEKAEKSDRSNKILIAKLKETIDQKQKEVEDLKDIIKKKDGQISILENQVDSLGNELSQTNQQLKESNAALEDSRKRLGECEINFWIGKGDGLIHAAETLQKVKGHGNMKRIKDAKLQFIREAIICYQNANQLGSTDASSKISYANTLYQLNK